MNKMARVGRTTYFGSLALLLVMISVGVVMSGYGMSIMIERSNTISVMVQEYTEEVNVGMVEKIHGVFRDNGYQVVGEDIQIGTPMTLYASIYLNGTVPSGYLELLNESGSTAIYTGILSAHSSRYWWFNGETGVKIAVRFRLDTQYPPGYNKYEISPSLFISVGGLLILVFGVLYFWVVHSELKIEEKKKQDLSKADKILKKLKE